MPLIARRIKSINNQYVTCICDDSSIVCNWIFIMVLPPFFRFVSIFLFSNYAREYVYNVAHHHPLPYMLHYTCVNAIFLCLLLQA